MATPEKPFYVNPAAAKGAQDLQVFPPFSFPGVTASMFPLQANISRLTDFCDSYLNMDIPDTIVHYFPALPYVYLAVINYGELSSLLFSAQNAGWVSQEEVLFLVPLEVWRRENGKMVFKEWACVSPFIFVSDTISLTTGREVYGWAKILGTVDKDRQSWLENPNSPVRVFSLKAPVFPKEYEGKREENRLLLEIERAAPPSLTLLPPGLGSLSSLDLPGAVKSWTGIAGSAFDMLTAWPVRGYRTTRSLRTTLEMAKVAAGQVLRLFPNPLRRDLVERTAESPLGYGRLAEAFANQITLKQFREAGDPSNACYQSLVSSRMGLDRINQWGFLGDYSRLLADPSGGYSIRLRQYAAYPVVSSLGLSVDRVEQSEGVDVSVLKPVFPFWTDVDLYYEKGKTVCYRHRAKYNSGGRVAWQAGSAFGHAEEKHAEPDHPTQSIPYNTTSSGSTQAVTGPFHFPDLTVQVYPLLASIDSLNGFVDHYLNHSLNPASSRDSGLWFEAFGEYVYLILESVGRAEGVMWSETNNIGSWADKSASFCVPVKMFRNGEFESLAMLTPYRFANDNRAVITDREINGRISVLATIQGLPDVWLEESGPVKERKYLELTTEVFPALDAGAQSKPAVLLQINGDLPQDYYNKPRWRLVGENWRGPLFSDLKRKTEYAKDHPDLIEKGKALALQLLALKAPFNLLNLKQYRDAEDPSRACYQSLVNVSRSIERVFDIREIEEERLFVRITYLQDFPIVKTLGLKVMEVTSGERVEQVLQPIRPFWMRLSMKENLGETIAWRVEQGAWNFTEVLKETALRQDPKGSLRVGVGVLEELRKRPQRLQQTVTGWLSKVLKEEAAEIQAILRGLTDAQRRRLAEALERSMQKKMEELKKISPDSTGYTFSTAMSVGQEAVRLSDPGDESRLRMLFRSISTNDLYDVVETLAIPLLDRLDKKARASERRLSVRDARECLAKLKDPQVIIEPILSAQWEHWGDPRWDNCEQEHESAAPKPDYCILKDTFQQDGLFGDGEMYTGEQADQFCEAASRFMAEEKLATFGKNWVCMEGAPLRGDAEEGCGPKTGGDDDEGDGGGGAFRESTLVGSCALRSAGPPAEEAAADAKSAEASVDAPPAAGPGAQAPNPPSKNGA